MQPYAPEIEAAMRHFCNSLDEKGRRRYAGIEALKLGQGGRNYIRFRVNGNGNVTADGSFTGGGADYAEMIKAEGSAAGLEPGDVLVISATQNRAVTKSSSANDPSLAGVYSTQPGFIGGGSMDAMPGYVPVAIVGIVPVKVTAANGPIHRGDLLTTSDLPGYAMLATNPQFGAILGKAMGEILEGEGVIQVLLLLK